MRIVLVALAVAALVALALAMAFGSTDHFTPQDVKDLASRVSAMRTGKADDTEDGGEDDGEDDGENDELDPARNEVKRDPEEPEELDEKYGSIALALRSAKRDAFDRLLAHYDSATAFDVDKLEADLMPSCSSAAQSVSLENSSPGPSGVVVGTP